MEKDISNKELLEFLKENMVTKDELREALRSGIGSLRQEMLWHFDGLVKRFASLEQELVFSHARFDRHKECFGRIEKHLGLT